MSCMVKTINHFKKMTTRINYREDSGIDKYGNTVFVPTDLKRGINRILRTYPRLDVPQDFSAKQDGDIWGDEKSLITQFRALPKARKVDLAVIEELEELIEEQEKSLQETGFFFVFVNEERPQDTIHFVKLKFPTRQDY